MNITYVAVTIDNVEIPMTDEQFLNVMKERDQNGKNEFLIRNALTEKPSWINLKTTRIYPIEMLPRDEGYLHDGTKVIKKFGQWVDARNPDVRLDAAYYPEIAQDRVLSRIEHESRAVGRLAAPQEKPALEMGRGNGGMQGIGQIVADREGVDSLE